MLIIFVVIIIVVGPKNLPEMVRKASKTMAMMRRAADEFKDQIMKMDQPQPVEYKTSSPYGTPEEERPTDQMTDIDGVSTINTYTPPTIVAGQESAEAEAAVADTMPAPVSEPPVAETSPQPEATDGEAQKC